MHEYVYWEKVRTVIGGLPIPYSLIIQMGNVRVPFPVNRPNGKAATGSMATPSASPVSSEALHMCWVYYEER